MNYLKSIIRNKAKEGARCAAKASLFLGAYVGALLPTQVWASGWADPAEGVLEDISDGLVGMAAKIIAIGIVIIGAWAAASGRIDTRKLVGCVAGAVLIFFGPEAIQMLVGAA